MSKKQGNKTAEAMAENIPPAPSVSVPVPVVPTTLEQAEKMSGAELIAAFGNKSNAIRGLDALGMKPGPIAKKLGIIYQHARNVLKRPLKRVIKAERDANKGEAPQQG